MISPGRIMAVFQKDVQWAANNLKLLTVMILPAVIVILFARIGGEALFVFSVTFVNAFVGMFSMSYLIIEEKNKGTLLALLTSPLKSSELLLGKYLFALLLCLAFTALAAVVNGRLDAIFHPVKLLNILFFAGTTCFYGYITGLFFKNEQEMSIFAPLIMFAFVTGDAINRSSDKGDLFAFFPEYHLSKVLSNARELEWQSLFLHTGFSALYFFSVLGFAVVFTKFYFSNNRESRFSTPLVVLLFGVLSFFAVSGFMSPRLINTKLVSVSPEGQSTFDFSTEKWSGTLTYDAKEQKIRTVVDLTTKKIFKVKSLSDGPEIVMGLREADSAENTKDLRREKINKDEGQILLGESELEVEGYLFHRWHFLAGEKIVLLIESFCGGQLLQASVEVEDPDLKKLNSSITAMDQFLSKLKPRCAAEEKASSGESP